MPETTPAEAEDDYQPTLVELLAESIPTELTATPHVGIGSARRLKIAWAVLPVVEAAIEQARREAAEHIAGRIEARRCPKSVLCNSCVCRPEDAATARATFPKETP